MRGLKLVRLVQDQRCLPPNIPTQGSLSCPLGNNSCTGKILQEKLYPHAATMVAYSRRFHAVAGCRADVTEWPAILALWIKPPMMMLAVFSVKKVVGCSGHYTHK